MTRNTSCVNMRLKDWVNSSVFFYMWALIYM